MVIAIARTRNFEFLAVGGTRDEATAGLLAAWRKHRRDYRQADPHFMIEMIEGGDVDYLEGAEVGAVFRNGERLL